MPGMLASLKPSQPHICSPLALLSLISVTYLGYRGNPPTLFRPPLAQVDVLNKWSDSKYQMFLLQLQI